MNTVWTNNPFPAVGIRPIIDGRRRGIRESLEAPTMEMARNAAKFISENLRYPDGTPVRCVVADTAIGGVAEAAACANKFHAENVGVSLSVTRCWCYGTETMDADPQVPKAVWGFNGTERPGAVYLACMLAGYAQRGMPCFGIYGRDVQDATDMTIPADVQEKLLRFVRAGLAVALMKGKSYLSVGSSSMGIAGGFLNVDFFQDYLGMRPENMDMCEVERRVAEGIYDKEEYARALAWVRKNCPEGKDFNPKHLVKGRAAKDADWEYVVKMAIILRDMMVGNPVLAEMGYGEEAVGRNALCAGFQGQRQWTDHWPNGDFAEAWLNTSFDWNGPREPFTFATENDTLNGVSMLLMHLLTNRAQLFADVRTFWSPDAVRRATGWKPTGGAKNGFIHLINSGAATLDATGAMKEKGKPAMKEWWNVTEKDMRAATRATKWCPAALEYFRGGGYSSPLAREGTRADPPDRRGLERGAAEGRPREADAPHRPHLALHVVRAAHHGFRRVQGRLQRDERLEREPRRDQLRAHRKGRDRARRAAAHPGGDVERRGRGGVPTAQLGSLRRGRPDRRRLPRLCKLRPTVSVIFML